MEIKVTALMTAPRYSATWARNIIDGAFKGAGVPLVVSGGVFYGQCMQRMLEDAIAAGIEYAITVDFDSIFTDLDVKRLLQEIVGRPDIAALASLQSRRGMPYPLFTCGPSRDVEFVGGEPMEVTTAHFGLTALRLSDIAKMPKPWFWSKPSPDGRWTDGEKTDDDIWFWKQLREAGLRVFVTPNVSIGHLEEIVAYFDDKGNHCYMYPNDWYKENKYEREPDSINCSADLAE